MVGLLGGHGHEDRVLPDPIAVSGLHADPSGPEGRESGHLHPGDGDADQRFWSRFERRGKDGGDDPRIGLVDGGDRLRPDVRLLGRDLVADLLAACSVPDGVHVPSFCNTVPHEGTGVESRYARPA